MSKNWNLQDIKPPEPRRKRPPQGNPVNLNKQPGNTTKEQSDTPQVPVQNGNRKRSRALLIGVVLVVVIIGAGAILSALYGGAEVTVFPKHRSPNLNAEFTATQNKQDDALVYEILSLEETGERRVTATGETTVEEQATGEIEIFKTTPGAQRLIRNTRFEAPDGKIFKIEESLVVPGAVTSNGETVPGSITASVYSDGTGEDYNLPADTRFTIPGLESDSALFESMYATNDEAFTGGFAGSRYNIPEDELATAKQGLQAELRNSLLQQINENVPPGFVTFPNAVTFTYNSLPAVEYESELVTIKEVATLQIPIFPEEEFAAYIADATIPGYEDLPVRIASTSVLSFEYTTATTSAANLANLDEIEFKLSGTPLIVWTYDSGKLKTDLLGANKTALRSVLSGYPAIERAQAVVRPFWKQTFPEDLDEIEIIEVIGEGE